MIHKYCMNGFYIVIDVNSGAIHEVDELVFEILELYKAHTVDEICSMLGARFAKADIEEAYSEICELERNGLLFTEDSHKAAADKLSSRGTAVKALCLNAAHDCNLRCEYCFAKKGSYGRDRGLMSADVGKAAIDLLIKSSGARKNLEVDFFGGEPLLNFDVVKEIVKYGNEQAAKAGKVFRFTLTTNGVLLDDEKTRYINGSMSNVVLSIDGRKEVNDRMRKDIGGSGTYDRLVPKFKKLVETRGQGSYYVRGTFTRENLDFCEDVLHLRELGFEKISIEPATEYIKESDLERIYAEYERLAVEILEHRKSGKEIEFFHYNIDLTGGPCAVKRVAGCGAGQEYLAVTPSGELYPCHQFIGHKQFVMGNVFDGVTRADIRAKFESSNLYTKGKCKTCFAKFYCGGGCAADGFITNGDINEPSYISCMLERKRVECALMIKVAQLY